jgi:saccharopine dehydrogenase (NAD+, L-lysine-forming)
VHTHIHFGHCYKNQDGWERYLSRFVRGNGMLYDLEFLTEAGRRVSAFGYHAGYAGTALALLAWSKQIQNPNAALPSMVSGYDSIGDLQADIQTAISAALPHTSKQYPRVLVMGALGRSGTGAVDACIAAGLPESNIIKWDMAETAAGGPFDEILDADIFVNCIYLSSKIPPFVTLESLSKPGRRLRTICDVSCDPTNPNNPVPVYSECSTFLKPTLPIQGVKGDGPPITQISIDHLPSLLPREASESFSKGLLPSMLKLRNRHSEGVWVRAEELFNEKVAELPTQKR